MPSSSFVIPAHVYPDNHALKARFDALTWFDKAPDNAILALAECGWGGDYASDAVAEWFNNPESPYHNADVERVFDYLHAQRNVDENLGFECHVDGVKALEWLRHARPELFAVLGGQQAIEEAFPLGD